MTELSAEVRTTISLHAAIEAVYEMARNGDPAEFAVWNAERLETAAKMIRSSLREAEERKP